MKEVVVVEPGKVEIREVPVPELANEDEVLIQMKAAGVCGSDHHIYHGSNPCSTYPRIPGHENAGIVAKVGKNVTNVKEGDHVTVTEGVLPSNYYYTIDPSLAMSGNYPFRERLLAREGDVTSVVENPRGFYVTVAFSE